MLLSDALGPVWNGILIEILTNVTETRLINRPSDPRFCLPDSRLTSPVMMVPPKWGTLCRVNRAFNDACMGDRFWKALVKKVLSELCHHPETTSRILAGPVDEAGYFRRVYCTLAVSMSRLDRWAIATDNRELNPDASVYVLRPRPFRPEDMGKTMAVFGLRFLCRTIPPERKVVMDMHYMGLHTCLRIEHPLDRPPIELSRNEERNHTTWDPRVNEQSRPAQVLLAAAGTMSLELGSVVTVSQMPESMWGRDQRDPADLPVNHSDEDEQGDLDARAFRAMYVLGVQLPDAGLRRTAAILMLVPLLPSQ